MNSDFDYESHTPMTASDIARMRGRDQIGVEAFISMEKKHQKK